MKTYRLAIIASLIAIVITTVMDFTGYSMFSALPLLGITLIFWLIERHSKTDFGLTFGRLKHYGIALLYPILVLGLAGCIAFLAGDFSIDHFNTGKEFKEIALGILVGPVIVLLTEEGFFRGWLWASFRRAGMNETKTLLWTSAIFVVWHISAVVSGTDYGLPFTQVPVYLVNAGLLSMIWGTMRMVSGSAIVPTLSHAVWNALAYSLFGYGQNVGALGITNMFILGPEVGYLGILLNGMFLLWIWKWTKSRKQNGRAI